MNFSAIERETLILFNDGEPLAEVTTCNAAWLRHMEALWGPGKKLGAGPYYRWDIPKRQVKYPRPKSQRKVELGKQMAQERQGM